MFKWTSAECIALPVALVVMIGISVGLHFLLKNRSEKIRKIPLQIIAVFCLGMEIAKQIYFAGRPEFTYYVLPLHFCSLFVYLFPLSQLFGKKVGRIFKPMAFCYGIAVLCLTYAFPNAIIGDSAANLFASFPKFHSFFFHFAVFLYCFLSVALDDYKPKWIDCAYVAGGVALYVCYAAPSAYALGANYANILYSGFAPLEQFRLSAGQVWYNVVLFIIGVSSMTAICALYCLLYKLVKRKTALKNKD